MRAKLKTLQMRDLDSYEMAEVLKVLEGKSFKLAYLWTVSVVCLMGIEILKVFLQKKEDMPQQILFYGIIMLVVGGFPSIWEICKEKYRIKCLKQGKIQGVVARCVYRSKQNKSTHMRNTYSLVTEFGESRKVVYKGRLGKSIETGDSFYVLRFGKREIIFVRFE